MGEDGVLDPYGSSGSSEKWPVSRYILKIQIIRFADGLDGYMRGRKTRMMLILT